MAYVRKTDTLVHDITERVDEMSLAAQKPHQSDKLEIGTNEYTDMRNIVVAKTWEDAPELQGKLPDDWCGTPTRVDVHLRNSREDRVAHFYIENTTANPMRLSPEFRNSSYPDVTVYVDELTGAAKTWIDSAAGKKEKLREIKEQFKNLRHQLVAFMQQHASLNTMITEMPELEMYVPDKYMQKYRAKSAPRAKVERPTNVEDLNIDVDALAAAAITHRMVTASSSS